MRYFGIVLGFSLKCHRWREWQKSLKFTRAQRPATINGNDEITCGIPTRLSGTYGVCSFDAGTARAVPISRW